MGFLTLLAGAMLAIPVLATPMPPPPPPPADGGLCNRTLYKHTSACDEAAMDIWFPDWRHPPCKIETVPIGGTYFGHYNKHPIHGIFLDNGKRVRFPTKVGGKWCHDKKRPCFKDGRCLKAFERELELMACKNPHKTFAAYEKIICAPAPDQNFCLWLRYARFDPRGETFEQSQADFFGLTQTRAINATVDAIPIEAVIDGFRYLWANGVRRCGQYMMPLPQMPDHHITILMAGDFNDHEALNGKFAKNRPPKGAFMYSDPWIMAHHPDKPPLPWQYPNEMKYYPDGTAETYYNPRPKTASSTTSQTSSPTPLLV